MIFKYPLARRTPDAPLLLVFFFFNDTATTEIYPLSLHDALPIWLMGIEAIYQKPNTSRRHPDHKVYPYLLVRMRSEEHTSELQSQSNLVCRLLLEKKKTQN